MLRRVLETAGQENLVSAVGDLSSKYATDAQEIVRGNLPQSSVSPTSLARDLSPMKSKVPPS